MIAPQQAGQAHLAAHAPQATPSPRWGEGWDEEVTEIQLKLPAPLTRFASLATSPLRGEIDFIETRSTINHNVGTRTNAHIHVVGARKRKLQGRSPRFLQRGLSRMEVAMRFPFSSAILLMLSCLPLKAQEPKGMDVGQGIICNTRAQVERFVSLRGDGKETAAALQTVNFESHEARACNLAFVMFTEDKPIAERAINGRMVSILQITVHAFGNGTAWQKVPALVQYTVATEAGQVA